MNQVKKVEQYVANRIIHLEKMKDAGSQKAAYAQLRRGVGCCPGDIPQLWGLLVRDLPEDMMSRNGAPSREEWAISTVLTLYAFHQQGKDPAQQSMNCTSQGLGHALTKLVSPGEDEGRILRRFDQFATASDMMEAVTHLRGIVGLLKAQGVGLDYPRLAGELYLFQSYEGAKQVRLTWGEDFYRYFQNVNKEDEEDE